jgi:hypothetical protein
MKNKLIGYALFVNSNSLVKRVMDWTLAMGLWYFVKLQNALIVGVMGRMKRRHSTSLK